MRAPDAVTSHDNIGRGIAFMVTATMANACMNALMKSVSGHYPATEIAFFRQLFAMLPVIGLIFANGGTRLLQTARPLGHLLRSIVGNLSLACLVFAYRFLPLTDVAAYNFTAPLFLTALSVPLLKEKVGVHRWTAVVIGFAGVVIMMRPGSDINMGVPLTVSAALLGALAMITIRRLSRTEHALTIVFYFTLYGTLFTGVTLLFSYVAPVTWRDWLVLVAIGIFGGFAQYCTTMAYRHAAPPAVAPYNYVTLIWTMLIQYFVWSDLPNAWTLTGAALIMLSGLYIIYRERQRKMALTSAATVQEAAD